MGLFKKIKKAVSGAVNKVSSGVRNTVSVVKQKTNDIREDVAESNFANSLGRKFNKFKATANDFSDDPLDFLNSLGSDASEFLSKEVRDRLDELNALRSKDPIDIIDPNAIIRETEEKVTMRIQQSADDVIDKNQDNILGMLDRVELSVLGELDDWSPSATSQLQKDFEVARGVLVNVIEIMDTMINSPEEINKRDFVEILSNNTKALSSTSEYVLNKIREQIPKENLLQDLFDLIDETNRERGLQKTKFVFMMGGSPEEEEETRSGFVETLLDDITEIKEELAEEQGKTPQNNQAINELKAELKTKLDSANKFDRPVALDLYTDIFQDVDPQYERLALSVLNDGETDLVDPPILTIETEVPRNKVVSFTFNQPEPTLDSRKLTRVETKTRKKLDQLSNILEELEPRPVPKQKTREEILMSKKLPEKEIIQRILQRTRLDDILKKEIVVRENRKKGGIAFTKDTRDKLRISKLEADLADVDVDNKILERLLKTTPSYLDLMAQYEEESKKDATKEKPVNNNITRNQQGFILSDETVEEGMLGIELVDKTMLRTTTVENLIDIDFKAVKLPVVEEDMVSRLKDQVEQLEAELTDLESNNENLLSSRTEQREKINKKEEQITSLTTQIENIQDRLAITPAEGQVFSIPLIEDSSGKYGGNHKIKYNVDYWLIENGKRRRIPNYAMAQVWVSQRNQPLSSIISIEPETIRKIPQGSDIEISEITNNYWLPQALEVNCYIPDDMFDGEKFKIINENVQTDVNDDLTISDVMTSMAIYAVKGNRNKDEYEANGQVEKNTTKFNYKQHTYDGRVGRMIDGQSYDDLTKVDPKLLSFNIWYSFEEGKARTTLTEAGVYRTARLLNNKYNSHYSAKAETKKIAAREAEQQRLRDEELRKQRLAEYNKYIRGGLGRLEQANSARDTNEEVVGFDAAELYAKAAWHFSQALKVTTYSNDKTAKSYYTESINQKKQWELIARYRRQYDQLIRQADFHFAKLNPAPELLSDTELNNMWFGSFGSRRRRTRYLREPYKSFVSNADKARDYYIRAVKLSGYVPVGYARTQLTTLSNLRTQEYSIIFTGR